MQCPRDSPARNTISSFPVCGQAVVLATHIVGTGVTLPSGSTAPGDDLDEIPRDTVMGNWASCMGRSSRWFRQTPGEIRRAGAADRGGGGGGKPRVVDIRTSERRSELSAQFDLSLNFNQVWWDLGASTGRTSLITDSSDGRLPPRTASRQAYEATPEAKWLEAVDWELAPADGPENYGTQRPLHYRAPSANHSKQRQQPRPDPAVARTRRQPPSAAVQLSFAIIPVTSQPQLA